MSWVLIDDDFPSNPKTVQAGPMAAALFVFGLCYCRKHHTQGFIPANAVPTLGIPTNPRKLVDNLIAVGYWERTEGGFQVHQYSALYDDAKDKAKKDARREAGRKGGLRSGEVRFASSKNEAIASACASLTVQPLVEPYRVRDGSASVVLSSEKKCDRRADDAPIADWFQELLRVYPQNRVSSGFMTQSAFSEIFYDEPGPAAEVWATIQGNLAVNMRSHEWRVKGMVPKLEKYLREGLWRQVHDEQPPAGERFTGKTNRTLTAAEKILREEAEAGR